MKITRQSRIEGTDCERGRGGDARNCAGRGTGNCDWRAELLTGGIGEGGQRSVWALQIAIDQINREGGIKSLGGANLRLVVADTTSENRRRPRASHAG